MKEHDTYLVHADEEMPPSKSVMETVAIRKLDKLETTAPSEAGS